MKAWTILLTCSILSLFLSVVLFATLTENKTSGCANTDDFERYTDAFRIFEERIDICLLPTGSAEYLAQQGLPEYLRDENAPAQMPVYTYTSHNPIYVLFLYLSIALFIASAISFVADRRRS